MRSCSIAAQAPIGKAGLTGQQYMTAKELALMQRNLFLPPDLSGFNFAKPAVRPCLR